uniref:Tumor protein D52 n=1 Tax=Mesocestoides corti TaxID=53468 RepID=A0A5K3FJB1_MESCO
MAMPAYSLDSQEKDGLYPNLPSAPPDNPPPYSAAPSKEEVEEELRKIEDEIATLRVVLASKLERSAALKRQLGIYGIDVAKDDMKRVANTITQSKPYTTVKGAVTKQWNNVTQTQAYKSVNNGVNSLFKSIKSSFSGNGQEPATRSAQPATSTSYGQPTPSRQPTL